MGREGKDGIVGRSGGTSQSGELLGGIGEHEVGQADPAPHNALPLPRRPHLVLVRIDEDEDDEGEGEADLIARPFFIRQSSFRSSPRPPPRI